MEASWGRLRGVLGRLGDVPGASWAVLGRPGNLLGRLRVAMDGSGFVVYLKGLESSKLLFFKGISVILWAVTAVLNCCGPDQQFYRPGQQLCRSRHQVLWTGTAVLEAARTDSRCSQTLPGTLRSSQELPEDARSYTKLILAGFRGWKQVPGRDSPPPTRQHPAEPGPAGRGTGGFPSPWWS